MIVDMHRHLWSLFERYPRVAKATVLGNAVSHHQASDDMVPDALSRGDEILAEMDATGIGSTVIFLGDYGLRLGEGVFSAEGENEIHAKLAKKHPGKLIPFLGIDPRRTGALELFRVSLEEWGMRGLKLHPASGFLPSDPACLPFFELAGQKGVPVLLHTGPTATPLLSNTTQPVYLDSVAADFPNTTIIMAHAGRCWWPEALEIAFCKPNIMLELSMWQWTFLRDEQEFVSAIAKMKATIGVERLLFGSDFPGMKRATSLSSWVQAIRDLPVLAKKHGYQITDEDVEAILGGNAQRLLGL